jgi:ankyrin repeat protein
MVRYLVNQGADIHANDDKALRCSARYGHLEVVRYLVGQGANIHANDDEALLCSARNGRLEVVRYLVGQGADINILNIYGIIKLSSSGAVFME